MTLSRMGGLAAGICAATYIVGFVVLVSLLAPLGFGTAAVDPHAVIAFITAQPGVMIAWNTTIYIVNALALTGLVVALSERLAPLPGWAAVSRAFGLIWATLVLGAGMVANVAVTRAVHLANVDPQAAADLWYLLYHVELGLGGGNEIAGGVWILCVSLAAWSTRCLPRPVNALGLLTGSGGLLTVLPPVGEMAGVVFGLGAIAWFLAVATVLIADRNRAGQGAGAV